MRRREFITLVGATAVGWPLAAHAQQSDRVRRIGVLVGYTEDDPEMKARLTAFLQGLDALGWSDGRNVHIETRFAPASFGRESALAQELVALKPDVILAHGVANVRAVQQASRVVPIVFIGVGDPTSVALAASLARPGGNLTGLLSTEPSITGKWLTMLKEIAPWVQRAALVGNPKTAPIDSYRQTGDSLARSLGIELVPSMVENDVDIERTIESFARMPNGGLILPPDVTTSVHRDLVVKLIARNRLPAVYGVYIFVEAGGLMSYGVDYIEQFRQVASYVDRILHGASPAELPVQAPTKFKVAINLKTAKALGLTVPNTFLVSADEVIE
jgi:putative ABC transport system substrate-binding protein